MLKQISISLNINKRTVQQKIKILKDVNIIIRIGSDRAGFFEDNK